MCIFIVMSMKSIILNEISLLLEKRVGQISANVSISIELRDTKHSNKQKFRHKDTNGMIITNSNIRVGDDQLVLFT